MKLPITLPTKLHASLLAEAHICHVSLNKIIVDALDEHVQNTRKKPAAMDKDAWLDIGRSTIKAALDAVTGKIGKIWGGR